MGFEWMLAVVASTVILAVIVATLAIRCSSETSATDVQVDPSIQQASKAPSGRIAFHSERSSNYEIYTMNADGSGVVQLTDNDSSDCCPVWSPDGSRIAFRSDRDNSNHVSDIYVMNADGTGVEQITDGSDNYHLAWSPDGTRITFTAYSEIYVMNADGTDIVRLTSNNTVSGRSIFFLDNDDDGLGEAYVRNDDGSVESFAEWESMDWQSIDWLPSWSPDSQRIVFQSLRDGDMEIYLMNADGSGVLQLTHNTFDFDSEPSWSPYGNHIAFVSDRDGDNDEIYVMNVDGGSIERLTDNEYPDSLPKWSHDGGHIAFSSFRDGNMEIYIMNADGTNVQHLTEGYSPAWAPTTHP